MIFDHPRDGDLPEMGSVLGMMANDQSRDGGHPWDRLEDFDNFWEGDLSGDSDHPKDGDHPSDGDHPRDGGCLCIFTILRDD